MDTGWAGCMDNEGYEVVRGLWSGLIAQHNHIPTCRNIAGLS